MKTLRRLTALLLMAYAPVYAMAWGVNGHRISGQIAENHLTPKARAAVRAILGESVAMASNWADFAKSDSTYDYLYNWHFVESDRFYAYPELVEYLNHDGKVDAYTKINFLIAELKKKNLSKANKLLYLRLLIHIAEDLHQPLHTGHDGDKGGNGIKLKWFSKDTNLHTIWDSELIEFQQLSYTEYVTALDVSTSVQRLAWQKAPITLWVFESNQIAQKVYNDTKPNTSLSYDYNFKYIKTVNHQLLVGGIRLAGLLNQLFG